MDEKRKTAPHTTARHPEDIYGRQNKLLKLAGLILDLGTTDAVDRLVSHKKR